MSASAAIRLESFSDESKLTNRLVFTAYSMTYKRECAVMFPEDVTRLFDVCHYGHGTKRTIVEWRQCNPLITKFRQVKALIADVTSTVDHQFSRLRTIHLIAVDGRFCSAYVDSMFCFVYLVDLLFSQHVTNQRRHVP